MPSRRALFRIALAALLLVPATVAAQYVPGAPVVVATGVNTSIPQIVAGVVNVLLFWATLVTTAIFLVGAAVMVGSAGGNQLDQGKKMMTAALIGYAIILSSWLILSTTVHFIAG